MINPTLDISEVRRACGDIGTQLSDRDCQELELLLLPDWITRHSELHEPDPRDPIGTGCITWTRCRTGSRGAGQVRIPLGKLVYVHRHVLNLLHGDVPADLEGIHLCDNPPCFRPSHLQIGTHQENMAQMAARGPSRHRHEWKARTA